MNNEHSSDIALRVYDERCVWHSGVYKVNFFSACLMFKNPLNLYIAFSFCMHCQMDICKRGLSKNEIIIHIYNCHKVLFFSSTKRFQKNFNPNFCFRLYAFFSSNSMILFRCFLYIENHTLSPSFFPLSVSHRDCHRRYTNHIVVL